MTWRGLVAVATVALLAGCTPVVVGRGRVGSGSPGSGTARPPASGKSSPPTGPTASIPASDIARVPVTTSIGDPVTADLCAAIGLNAMRGIGNDLTPIFDSRQFPPGCSVSLHAGTKAVLDVAAFAAPGKPSAQKGRTSRMSAGRRIYSYPFVAATGECRREVGAHAVVFTVNSQPAGGAKPNLALDCAGTDAMAERLTAVLATGHVPRLRLPASSLTRFDACAVTRAAAITTTLPAFIDGTIVPQGFGASCEVRPKSVFLFFNYTVSDTAKPANSTQTTELGHLVFQTSAQPSFCSYVSTQHRMPDGRYEQMSASATVSGSAQVPDLCTQTAQALALYLSAAGLS